MRRLALGLFLLSTVACRSLGPVAEIQVASVHILVEKVMERTSEYMTADLSLAKIVRKQSFVDMQDIRAMLDLPEGSTVSVVEFGPPTERLCDQHDNYVAIDATIMPRRRKMYLRSSTILLRIIAQAKQAAEPRK